MKKFIKNVACLGVITGLVLESFPVWAIQKDESIYAKLENNGQVNKVIVTEHLQGTDVEKTIDKTRLTDIQNINGEEKYTNTDGKLVWESNGKDIYYQGQTKEELPISLNIKYYLDGEEKPIKDMLGKKGNVKIVLKYTNNDKHNEYINGKYETIYTPFVVATTTILSNTTNKNINVTNGKVVGNGTSSIVVMLSTPGLYESLGIEKLKGMDEAIITYDTDSFSLSSIYSVSTPKLVDSSDLNIFNDIDGLYSSINTLVSSSNKIKSGSKQLLEGAEALKAGVNKLHDGINKAYNGSKEITNGVSYSIDSLRKDNSKAIDNNTLSYIQKEAVNGAKNGVSQTFSDEYKQNIANNTWSQVQENLNPNDENVVQIVTDSVTNSVTDSVPSAVENAVKSSVNKAVQDYLTETNQLSDYSSCEASKRTDASCLNVDYKALEYIKNTATLAATLAAKEAATNASKNAASTTASKVAGYVAENVSKQVSVQVSEQTAYTVAENTASSISESVAKQVAENAKETAKKQTTESLSTLLNGLNELTNGLNEINTKMYELDQGTSTLKDGIFSLDSGIGEFNSKGINKISSLVNGDVKSLEGKLKALGKLSASYGTFDDKENGTEGATKIIMVVDEVKAPITNITTTNKISKDEDSLWDRIKGLFK